MSEPKSDDYTIIAFVNGKSGGKLGSKVLQKLSEVLPSENVYDLMDAPIGPEKGLKKYKDLSKVKIIAAGGDGTVAWILSALDKTGVDPDNFPIVGVLPLGTGNDMSRILKWGGSYTGGDLKSFITNVKEHSMPIRLDRWKVTAIPLKDHEVDSDCESCSDAESEAKKKKAPKKKEAKKDAKKEGQEEPKELHLVCNNYFSLGIGASIIKDYEEFRNKHKGLVTNRTVGLGWYGLLSVNRMVKPHSSLRKIVSVKLDGKDLAIPKEVQEFTILNIPSYMGGADTWGKYKNTKGQKSEPRINDKQFEIVGFKGVSHLGRVKAGISASGGVRIGQGQVVEITNHRTLNAQIDGEPLLLPPCKITIEHHNQSNMLLNMSGGTKDEKWMKKLIGDQP